MRTNKKPLAGATGAAKERTNCGKCTPCHCATQQHFPGMEPPPPDRAEGTVAAYLLARPGWHDRGRVAVALGLSGREVRAQAEYSGGTVIFGSGKGQGLKHSAHADAWEVRQCAAELRNRAMSHLRRAEEVEGVLAP